MKTVIALELRQRLKGAAWWILLAIWVLLIGVVTGLSWWVSRLDTLEVDNLPYNPWLYSFILFFVLLLAALVTPALSGNSINGDRQDGVLATTQVTSVTAGQIVWGKFFAAYLTAIFFLLAASPFLVFAAYIGNIPWLNLVISLLAVLLEMAVFCAIGVGLSGIMKKPLFSVVTTYLVIALFGFGTLIATGLSTMLITTEKETTIINIDDAASTWDEEGNYQRIVCAPPVQSVETYYRSDYVWWILAANPFVVVADATPSLFDNYNSPADMFTMIKYGVRSMQVPPEMPDTINYCEDYTASNNDYDTPEEVINSTLPSWFVGFGIHIVIGLLLLLRAVKRTKTPIKKLPRGQRIA